MVYLGVFGVGVLWLPFHEALVYINIQYYVYKLRAISQAKDGLDTDKRDVTAGRTYKARSSVAITIDIRRALK